MNLEELCAREQIREVLYSYCRGLDRGDVKLIEGVYHPDATDYHGTFKGLGREFASHIVASMDPVAAPAQHHLTNILIRFDQPGGKAGSVETYFIAFHPQSVAEDDSTELAFVGGRYLDRFEHRDGAWRISERRVVIDWSRAQLPGEAWDGEASFPKGTRREADPSATLFVR